MVIPEDVLTATQARFEAREVPRAGTEEKIAAAQTPQGRILDVDAPERVELRSRRVLRQPVVMDALKATADTSPVQPGQVRDDQVLGDLVLERIIGGSNLLGIAFLELGTAVSRTVQGYRPRPVPGPFLRHRLYDLAPPCPDEQPRPARRPVRPVLPAGVQFPERHRRPSPGHITVRPGTGHFFPH